MLRGLDASSVQGALPVNAIVDAGLRFAILRAQVGNDGFDPWFERNMRACLDAGIEVFPYCFFYPLPLKDKKTGRIVPTRDPKVQAQMFVDRVHRFPEMRGRPIFIDEEWPEVENWAEWGCSAAQINEAMRVNAAEVARLSGRTPALYTYLFWWNAVASGADVSWAGAYPLWMAWYVKSWPGPGSKPRTPKPWSSALFWQWDGNGGELLPNGVDSDFCVFDGDEADLRAFASGASDSTPTLPVEVPSRRPPRIEDFAKISPIVPLGRPALDGDLPTTDPDPDAAD